jgi:hypothetical protein
VNYIVMYPLEAYVLMMFQNRDVRGGLGRRDVFYQQFYSLYQFYPGLAYIFLDIVPEYGTWGDVFRLCYISPYIMWRVSELVEAQLIADEEAVLEGRTPSLMAKWAPRENKAHGWIAKNLASYILRNQSPTTHQNASYRRRMAALNRALGTVEILECGRRWSEVEPKAVPSKARHIKRAAYMRHECGEKFTTFFQNQTTRSWVPDPHRYAPVLDILQQFYGT